MAIAYSDPALGGTAANHVDRLMASLDTTGAIRAKTRLTAPSKPLADFVVAGGADFGLTQITEIHADPRLELAGPLPGPFQYYTHYAASLVVTSTRQDIGQTLIGFLASPVAATVMRAKGFEQLGPPQWTGCVRSTAAPQQVHRRDGCGTFVAYRLDVAGVRDGHFTRP